MNIEYPVRVDYEPLIRSPALHETCRLNKNDSTSPQDPKQIDQDMNERIKFGRFWFRQDERLYATLIAILSGIYLAHDLLLITHIPSRFYQ